MVLESTPASTAAPADQANVSTALFTSSQQAPADLEALLSKLMELLLSFPNKSVAIGLALKAASLLEEEQEVNPVSTLTSCCCQILALLIPLSACSRKRLLCAALRFSLQMQDRSGEPGSVLEGCQTPAGHGAHWPQACCWFLSMFGGLSPPPMKH